MHLTVDHSGTRSILELGRRIPALSHGGETHQSPSLPSHLKAPRKSFVYVVHMWGSSWLVIRICEHQYLTFDRFQRILKVLSVKDSGDKLDTLTPCHGLHSDSRSVTNTSSQQPLRKCKRQHVCFTANFKHTTQKVSFSTIIGNSSIRFIRNLLSTNTRILKNSVKSSKSWTSSFVLTCGQATPTPPQSGNYSYSYPQSNIYQIPSTNSWREKRALSQNCLVARNVECRCGYRKGYSTNKALKQRLERSWERGRVRMVQSGSDTFKTHTHLQRINANDRSEIFPGEGGQPSSTSKQVGLYNLSLAIAIHS